MCVNKRVLAGEQLLQLLLEGCYIDAWFRVDKNVIDVGVVPVFLVKLAVNKYCSFLGAEIIEHSHDRELKGTVR